MTTGKESYLTFACLQCKAGDPAVAADPTHVGGLAEPDICTAWSRAGKPRGRERAGPS